MMEKLLHTPEGVRDIYDNECKKKLKVLDKMHHALSLYSYNDIETPHLSFLIYSTKIKVQQRRTRCINSLTERITHWFFVRI